MRSPFSKFIRSLCFAISLFGLVPRAWAATTVTPEAKEVGSGGASYHLTVTSDTTWTVSTTATWVTVSPDSGSGPADLVVEVTPNLTGFDRHATLTIDDQTHTITQYATALSATTGGSPRTQRSHSQPLARVASVVAEAAEASPATPGNTFRLDTSFGARFEANGSCTINTVMATPDGGFIVGGDFSSIGGQPHNNLAYVQVDGTVDPTFNRSTVFDGPISQIAIQQVGMDLPKLIVCGSFTTVDGAAHNGIARLNGDGTLDPTFTASVPTGPFYGGITSLVVQADGKIVVSGGFETVNGSTRNNIARLNADGTLDMDYDPAPGTHGQLISLAVQADGKIIVGGLFSTFKGTARNNIARLNVDGSLDTSFDPGAGFTGGPLYWTQVDALAVQADGKIVAGGIFGKYQGTVRTGIARLNTDGTLDTSYNPFVTFINSPYTGILTLALQTDGKVLVGGGFTAINGTSRNLIARLNADGTLDTSFDPGTGFNDTVKTLTVLPGGKIVACGGFTTFNNMPARGLVRLTAAGALDTSVVADAVKISPCAAHAVPVSGGKFLVYGNFDWVNGTACHGIARLSADGTLDPTFTSNITSDKWVDTLAVQADGEILVAFSYDAIMGLIESNVWRLNADGTLDPTFNLNFSLLTTINALALQTDGKVVVGGESLFKRLNTDGTLDTTFDPGSGFQLMDGTASVYALAVQADGKIVAGGYFGTYNTTARRSVARLNADGTLDTTFDPGTGFGFSGSNLDPGSVYSLALQADGKIVAGGYFGTYNGTTRESIARLNADGTLDTTFDPGTGKFSGTPYSLAMQADGKIVAGGSFTIYGDSTTFSSFGIRLNTDGTLDTGFSIVVDGLGDYLYNVSGPGGVSLSFTDDGRLILPGGNATSGDVVQSGLVLLKPDGIGPVFTTQPQSATVTVGGTVTFTAAATGTPTPGYQWYKGTTLLTGQTEATLTLSNVQTSDAGSYTVVATNDAGSATSDAAILTVNAPVTPTPTTPTTPSSGGGSGGGGGGAMGECYLAMLLAAAALRYRQHRCRSNQQR